MLPLFLRQQLRLIPASFARPAPAVGTALFAALFNRFEQFTPSQLHHHLEKGIAARN